MDEWLGGNTRACQGKATCWHASLGRVVSPPSGWCTLPQGRAGLALSSGAARRVAPARGGTASWRGTSQQHPLCLRCCPPRTPLPAGITQQQLARYSQEQHEDFWLKGADDPRYKEQLRQQEAAKNAEAAAAAAAAGAQQVQQAQQQAQQQQAASMQQQAAQLRPGGGGADQPTPALNLEVGQSFDLLGNAFADLDGPVSGCSGWQRGRALQGLQRGNSSGMAGRLAWGRLWQTGGQQAKRAACAGVPCWCTAVCLRQLTRCGTCAPPHLPAADAWRQRG